MTDAELIRYLASGLPKGCRVSLAGWFKTNRRYRNFCLLYKDKIRKKLQTPASVEDKDDVFFELEFPYLILFDDRFDVVYEKHGDEATRAPDFTVTFEHQILFNAEVKRIRRGEPEVRYDTLEKQMRAKIGPIPSCLAVTIYARTTKWNPNLIDRLESKKEEIIQFIRDTIQVEEDRLSFDANPYECPIPGFENEFLLFLTKPSGKPDNKETDFYALNYPVPYTQKEFRKFGDIICDSVSQMRSAEINLLMVSSAGATHDPDDLRRAIDSIGDLSADDSDEFFSKKGFRDKGDFLQQFRNLGGILFRSAFKLVERYTVDRNFLWCNESASRPIPKPIQEYLKKMDRPATLSNSIWNALWSQ